jgi:thiamine pyrophosphate-dependent acetolactate synthase large subunit-like protein
LVAGRGAHLHTGGVAGEGRGWSFAMLTAEFSTAVRHGRPIKVVINDDNSRG